MRNSFYAKKKVRHEDCKRSLRLCTDKVSNCLFSSVRHFTDHSHLFHFLAARSCQQTSKQCDVRRQSERGAEAREPASVQVVVVHTETETNAAAETSSN